MGALFQTSRDIRQIELETQREGAHRDLWRREGDVETVLVMSHFLRWQSNMVAPGYRLISSNWRPNARSTRYTATGAKVTESRKGLEVPGCLYQEEFSDQG